MKMIGVLAVFSPILLVFGGFYFAGVALCALPVLAILLLLDKAFPKPKPQQQLPVSQAYLDTTLGRPPK